MRSSGRMRRPCGALRLAGADVDRPQGDGATALQGGYTPLLFAARQGDIESARLLLAAGAGESPFTLPDRPVGIPETYDEHARLLLDLLLLTYQADITRVFSLQLGACRAACDRGATRPDRMHRRSNAGG